MPTQVQFRRGNEGQNNNFKGAAGEISVNTSTNSLRVHNGIATGGFELARTDLSNVGNASVSGIITATKFVGDGTDLTGVSGSKWVTTSAGIHTLSNVGIGTTNPKVKLQINGILGFGTVGGYNNIPSTNILIGDNTTGSSLTPQAGQPWKGLDNIFIGVRAGAATTDGNNNNFIGKFAGCSNTSGYYNNFFGSYAGKSNTTGSGNNFLGFYAVGRDNTTGKYNNFFGYGAGKYNTTGSYNNFFGYYAGQSNTTGICNNFIGNGAGYCNTTGDFNNFFGVYSGNLNTSGSKNTFIGYYAGVCNITGNYNLFLGSNVGVSTSASYKIVLGEGPGSFDSLDTTKDYQLAIGIATVSNFTSVKKYWLSGNEHFNISIDGPALTLDRWNQEDRIYIGRESGIGWNFDPTEVGHQFGQIVIGAESGIGLTTLNQYASGNIIIGNYSGKNITGDENIFLGSYSAYGSCQLSGDWNIGIGQFSGNQLTTGRSNVMSGRGTGNQLTTGSYNSFFGTYSGNDATTGGYNSFFGYLSGFCNTTGIVNSFFGSEAGRRNLTGCSNTFVGNVVGSGNTFGSYNTFLGSYSGISTRSSYKIVIGAGTGANSTNYLFDSPNTTKDTQFAVGVRTDANPSKYWLVGDENFNVGIGTTNPKVKLQINGVLGFEVYNTTGIWSGTNILLGGPTTGSNLLPDSSGYGMNNVFMSIGAGRFTTTGYYNNFFGKYSGHFNTTGSNNNFLGAFAGKCNTAGGYNNFFGYSAGYNNTTGGCNNFFGSFSGYCNTTGSHNNFFGALTGCNNTTGTYNIFLGEVSGFSNTTGCWNVFIGTKSGESNTTGDANASMGYYSGGKNTTGKYNSFFGNSAGICNVTGSYNIFFGGYTGIIPDKSFKIIIGSGKYQGNHVFDAPKDENKQFAIGINSTGNTEYWLVGDENFNIGIGTTNPTTKLQVGGTVTATAFVGNGSGLTGVIPTRSTVSGITTQITANGIGNTNITGFKTYGILKVGLSTAGWLRLYTDATSRNNDASRSIGLDPEPGNGLILETITTGLSTSQIITPLAIGFNIDAPAQPTIYASVTNLSGVTTSISINLTILKMEE